MALLGPLLSIGSNLFGTLMGNQNNSSQAIDQTVNQNVDGTNTTGTSDSFSGKTTQNGKQKNQQTNNQNTNQVNNQTQNTTGTESRLDAQTRALLQKQVQGLLGSASNGVNSVNRQLTDFNKTSFDPTAFVNGITQAATSTAMGQQESDINQLEAGTGGTTGTNSAAALLANKIRTNTASQIAGVRSSATAQAQQIVGQRAQTAAGLSSSLNDSIGGMLQLLEGAGATTTNSSTGRNALTGNTRDSSYGVTDTSNTQQQNQTQTQQQIQQQAAKTLTTTKGTATDNKVNNDWTKFWGSLGSAFNSNFIKSGAGSGS
jgi:hypothetical protein